MSVFEIQGPDGSTYEVEAPSVSAAVKALGWGTKEPDKYQQAAREDIDKAKAAGIGSSPWQRRIIQGASFNAADEILAGLQTPFEMIRRGTFNPAEGYRYAKAREDAILEDARTDTGALGTAAEIAGGIGSGLGVARSAMSAGSRLAPNAGLGARSWASAKDAAALGGVSGAMEGNDLGERAQNAAIGAGVGGAVGGAMPGVVAAGQSALSPITSNISARVNPQGFAQNQLARGISESGRSADDIATDVARANYEGQGMYTVADAMGNAGQRMLSTVTRAPGAGRQAAAEFLEQRQAGQGGRVAGSLAEGFDSPQTAEQVRSGIISQRTADASRNYGAARAQSGAVNVTPAIEEIDRTLLPGVTRTVAPNSTIADDSIEGVLRRARGMLTDGRSQVSRFDEAFRVKQELDNLIDRATPTQQRALIPVRNALDDELAHSSQPYAAARDQFRRQSQAIEAVDQGRTAATRGRPEDTIPRFQGMRPDQQQAFRAGYVDPQIESVQGAAFGVNKARPFTSDAFRAESNAMAPGAPLMGRRLDREMRMFETRNHALGGSRTADNLADEAAMGVDPTLAHQVLTGNWGGAATSALRAGQNALTGNTPAVREELSRLLLQRGGNVNPAELRRMLTQAISNIQMRARMAAILGRGAAGGLGVGPSAAQNR